MLCRRLTVWTSLACCVVIASDADATPRQSPVLPLLLASPSAATQVAVHVAERFQPFVSETTVGPYSTPPAGSGFRVMFSFAAYAFTQANAATMDCYSLFDDGRRWHRMPRTANDEPGFCVRRDIADDDADSFGVAVFQKTADGASLVHAAAQPSAQVIAEAVLRGWTAPPIVAFRVSKLQRWQTAPLLTLVANITAIAVDSIAKVAAHCPPDPTGAVTRFIEGGDYYRGTHDHHTITMLCVSYAQRSLQDLNDEDEFFAKVRLVGLSDWRFNVCPWGSDEVMEAELGQNLLVEDADRDLMLLCYKHVTLADDADCEDLYDTDRLLKRITVDSLADDWDKRLVIEHHDENAWALPDAGGVDMKTINEF